MGTTKKAAAKKTTAKAPRLPRTATAMTAGDERLVVIAAQLKDGRFRSMVTHRTGSGDSAKTERGMVAFHATLAEAGERAAALVSEAALAGWQKKATRQPKAPAFTSIPKPPAK
jgi:hypothetical protein